MSLSRFNKYKVFISHAGEDKATIAIPLREKLKGKGITAFVDATDLRTGEHALDAISSAIETADIAVIILSPEFVAREWPMKELLCFLRRQEEDKSNGKSVPAVIPFFYRLSITELYNEPRHESTDRDIIKMYRRARFLDRMASGDPEANVDTIKKALLKLHRITGIENFVGASSENSYAESKRRDVLLRDLVEVVVRENRKYRRSRLPFVVCILLLWVLFLLVKPYAVAPLRGAFVDKYLRWPSQGADDIPRDWNDDIYTGSATVGCSQPADSETSVDHKFDKDESEMQKADQGYHGDEGERRFAGAENGPVVDVRRTDIVPAPHEIAESEVDNVVRSGSSVQDQLEDNFVVKDVDVDEMNRLLSASHENTDRKDDRQVDCSILPWGLKLKVMVCFEVAVWLVLWLYTFVWFFDRRYGPGLKLIAFIVLVWSFKGLPAFFEHVELNWFGIQRIYAPGETRFWEYIPKPECRN